MKIIKRDGRIVDYDRQKIAVAIEKANGEVEVFQLRKTRQGYVVDTQDTLIIGYDTEETQTEIIDGVTITHF